MYEGIEVRLTIPLYVHANAI